MISRKAAYGLGRRTTSGAGASRPAGVVSGDELLRPPAKNRIRFLMTGYDKKVLRLITDKAGSAVILEVTPLGDGAWQKMEAIQIEGGYKYFVFPTGFSAQWVRLTSQAAQTISAEFLYT